MVIYYICTHIMGARESLITCICVYLLHIYIKSGIVLVSLNKQTYQADACNACPIGLIVHTGCLVDLTEDEIDLLLVFV